MAVPLFGVRKRVRNLSRLAAHRLQVVSHSVRLLLQRHVRQIVDRVERARLVGIEPSKLRIEVVLRRALRGDEFEALAQCAIRRKAGDQDLGELATGDDPVAGIAGMTAIFPGSRARARTAWPFLAASATTRRSMLPVAPITSTVIR